VTQLTISPEYFLSFIVRVSVSYNEKCEPIEFDG